VRPRRSRDPLSIQSDLLWFGNICLWAEAMFDNIVNNLCRRHFGVFIDVLPLHPPTLDKRDKQMPHRSSATHKYGNCRLIRLVCPCLNSSGYAKVNFVLGSSESAQFLTAPSTLGEWSPTPVAHGSHLHKCQDLFPESTVWAETWSKSIRIGSSNH